MKKDNIILIGMPGSGKSTVGVLLAKTLGYQFIDTDLIISKQQKTVLQKIIDERGLEEFLNCEEQAGLSVDTERTVIATGGSMVLKEKAMEHLKSLGQVVFFQVSIPELKSRLRNIKTRGIAAKPGETLESIYEERLPYYEKYADITVEVSNNAHLEEVVEQLVQLLKETDARA